MHQTAHPPLRRVVDNVHLGNGVEEEVVAVVHDPVVHLGPQELGVVVVEAKHLKEPPENLEGVLPQVAEQGAHGLVPQEELQAGHLEDGGPRQEGQLGHAGPRRLLKHTN